jgi:replicative superfamily II helicase
LGLFSLISGWHPQRPEKLVVRALTKNASALSLNDQDYLTSNRNHVAAQIAAEYAELGQRVIVFCNDSRACGSVAKELNELLKPASVPLNTQQEAFRIANLEDVGAENAVYNPVLKRAAVHHGDLLARKS